MALGAISRDLLRMVVGDGLKMAAYGAAIGGVAVVVAAWATRPRIRDSRPRRASVHRLDGRRRPSLPRSRRSFRRGEPRGCRRWSRSATNQGRCGNRRARPCERRSHECPRRSRSPTMGGASRTPTCSRSSSRRRAARRLSWKRSSARSRRCASGSALRRWCCSSRCPGNTARSSRFRQDARPSAPAACYGFSREPAPVLQLPAALHDRRSRQLAAVGARPLSGARRGDSDVARQRRPDGCGSPGQGRHPRPAVARRAGERRAVQRRREACSCGNARSN